MASTKTMQVYVGTYKKYNEGNLFGEWIDVTDFSSLDEFMDACKELHSDESDPEFMYQDHEGIPSKYIGESFIKPELWEYLDEIAEMSESEIEALDDYFANDSSRDIDDFREDYAGQWDSEVEFAENIIDDCYNLDKMMGGMARYFDYESFARDLFIGDYWMSANGHVFRNS